MLLCKWSGKGKMNLKIVTAMVNLQMKFSFTEI